MKYALHFIGQAFHRACRIDTIMRGPGRDGQDINDEGIIFEVFYTFNLFDILTYLLYRKGH